MQTLVLRLARPDPCVPETVFCDCLLKDGLALWDQSLPQSEFSLHDMCYANSPVTLGPGSRRQQIPQGESVETLVIGQLAASRGNVYRAHQKPAQGPTCLLSIHTANSKSLPRLHGSERIFLKSK